MLVAVSDYDGTLMRDNEVSSRDLDAIGRWRAAGNPFVLATGRDLGMTVHEVRRWSIPFDFLICANGCGIYDRDLALLDGVALPDELIPAILHHPATRHSLDCRMLGDDLARVLFNSRDSRFASRGLPHRRVTFEQALACRGLRQINLAFPDPEQCARWADAIETDLGDLVAVHRNASFIDVTVKGVGKETGILRLLALRGWDEDMVRAIGDGGNDEGMVRRFRGYAIAGGDAAVLGAASAVVPGVADMLDGALAPTRP